MRISFYLRRELFKLGYLHRVPPPRCSGNVEAVGSPPAAGLGFLGGAVGLLPRAKLWRLDLPPMGLLTAFLFPPEQSSSPVLASNSPLANGASYSESGGDSGSEVSWPLASPSV